MEDIFDVIVIGGGQSALACGYYLRRAKLNYLILDKQNTPGGAWLHAWDSLTLFSPADYSSLPGWIMPKTEHKFPPKQQVIDYLEQYEKHYQLHIKRNSEVIEIKKVDGVFYVHTHQSFFKTKAVISATGTWGNPFIPHTKGIEKYKGIQIHSSNYKNPEKFNGLKTLVVGEGNSGAQIVAEVSKITSVKWATKKAPDFLPDEVDGYYLFKVANAKYKAELEGKVFDASQYSLGSIVMVPPVKEARERGALISNGSFLELYEKGVIWNDGNQEEFDAIIWCTGFGYDTSFLKSLVKTDEKGAAKTNETKSLEVEGLWFVGYGNWSGYASATLIGVNRTAKQTVIEIEDFLSKHFEIN
ncbi:ArsO family NAD(P)H-dependent flavin-containing monooxygenase [Empedobacter falsenii]|uniref:ArsO family NAD(P)H-dependent flavin-containing monooxygenase n=2 Tax=Empedobacter TaxID=59734 RepID=A0ABY8V9S9_9FLAO|nr:MULTISPECIES: ArsO family NAD(P)H-dependent flavin-containing monooxygenase [Empedobacter]MCA4776214.1 NAD(P)/FAD-dependent oxidoreductase [Empedobacter stercoris]MCA4808644.1 NAD(P)/FAD-dependent oxidoreductase [Empedobacter stercoris]MDM1523630.1 NAD(P)/FAD-dependent oxidoreductase [Empedobacter sp. 225-1]MDM1543070.1 NAD(P)/FAD-dependent oxidoreductase [Empedobacter sp. 189-2]NOJ74682.1 NAD(P)/FAD-dependent oxidoreductase [Empedobacter stercoris]